MVTAIFRKTPLLFHDEEVWLKIGGDSGGGSFKFWITPLVSANPDRITICTMIFTGEETWGNMEATLGQKYKEAIHDLQQRSYKYADGRH